MTLTGRALRRTLKRKAVQRPVRFFRVCNAARDRFGALALKLIVMEVRSIVASEIQQTLQCFGLHLGADQAAELAAVYFNARPKMPAERVLEFLLQVPNLSWLPDETDDTKRLTLLALIEHLDSMYFVATFEHDHGPPAMF